MTEPAPYADDLTGVVGPTLLVRRINSRFYRWADDGSGRRVTSQAMQFLDEERARRFDCPGPGLSVIVLAMVEEADLIERYHEELGEGLAYVDEKLLRGDDERGIHVRPRPDEPAHAVVFPLDPTRKDLPGGVKKALAAFATLHMIVPPRQ